MGLPFEHFLSDADEGLSRTSARDPLGFEVLWTAFGREIVPHLSTVSTGATNFGVLLVLLECVQSYVEERGPEGIAFADLMTSIECLQVYSILEEPRTELTDRLLGRQRAQRLREDGEPMIGPGHEVLASQFNLGLFGRYINPLQSMGLVDGDQALSADARQLVSAWPGFEPLRASIHAVLRRLEADGDVKFGSFTQSALMRQLRSPETLAFFAPLLKHHMMLDTSSQHRVRRLYGDLAQIEGQSLGGGHAEALLAPRKADPAIEDVCDLEWALCRLDALFEGMFNVSKVGELADYPGVADVVNELVADGPTIVARLLRHPQLSDAARHRLDGLRQVMEGGDISEVAQRLARYHQSVMDGRRRAAWIDVMPGGRVLVVRAADQAAKVTPRWRRTYYLSSLADFRADLVRAGVS